MNKKHNLQIAWFTALSETIPLKSSFLLSRIAENSSLAGLDITLFVADADWKELLLCDPERSSKSTPGSLNWRGFRVKHYLSAFLADEQVKFDFSIHSIENHARSAFCQHSVRIWPGLSLILDGSLAKFTEVEFYHPDSDTQVGPEEIDETLPTTKNLSDYKSRGWSMEIFDYLLAKKNSSFFDNLKCGVFDIETSQAIAKSEKSTVNPIRFEYPLSLTPEIIRKKRRVELKNKFDLCHDTKLIGVVNDNSLWADQNELLEAYRTLILNSKNDATKTALVWFFSANSGASCQAEVLKKAYLEKGLDPSLFRTCEIDNSIHFEELIGGLDFLLATEMRKHSGTPLSFLLATEHLIPVVSSRMTKLFDSPNINYVTAGADYSLNAGLALTKLVNDSNYLRDIVSKTEKFLSDVCARDSFLGNLNHALENYVTKEVLEARRAELERAKAFIFTQFAESLSSPNEAPAKYNFSDSVFSSLELAIGQKGN